MWNLLVVGSGPAGLGASIEAAKKGAKVLLVDENEKPGGQLFKQIHKFFGSKEHFAGRRGYQIGEDLLKEALDVGVTFYNNTICEGFDESGVAVLKRDGHLLFESYDALILATGGIEKGLPFKGWTKAGVMTAGCAQTFVNVHGVQVGREILVIGSGNVGLITAYQMIQSGMKVKGIVEIQDHITGYEVHLNKIKKLGVPLYLNHSIQEALGKDTVERALLKNLETDETIEVEADTILLAVGLRSNGRLATLKNCTSIYTEKYGGIIPIHNPLMETTVENIFVAGDICGIEEASTALDEGRLAGLSAIKKQGFLVAEDETDCIRKRLDGLRSGAFGVERKIFKDAICKEASNYENICD